MAYTKIKPVRNHLDRCLNYTANPNKTEPSRLTDTAAILRYTQNPDKTERQFYVSGFNCTPDNALEMMRQTKQRWNKTSKGHVEAYHVIQSFAPGEISPETAHKIGCEFAKRALADQYEVTVSTHLDRKHLHNHVVFNAVSFVDGKMYRDDLQHYYESIRKQSDVLCREYGLSIIDPERKGKAYNEWQAEQQGQPTMRGMIRQDVDTALQTAISWETFVGNLRRQGYLIKYGDTVKYATIKHKTGSKAIRLKSLGEAYTEQNIRKRISEKNMHSPEEPDWRISQQPNSVPVQADKSTTPQPNETVPPTWQPWQPPHKRSRTQGRYRGRFPFARKTKVKGFMALYYYYVHLLGRTKQGKSTKRCYYLLREDFQKFDRYCAQSKYLWINHIETEEQLVGAKTAASDNIERLTARRADLYKQRKGEPNEQRVADLTAEIKGINRQLCGFRKEIRLCGNIEADAALLRQRLIEVREAERQEQIEQENKQKKERMQHEQRR